jgi:hypothetical protein
VVEEKQSVLQPDHDIISTPSYSGSPPRTTTLKESWKTMMPHLKWWEEAERKVKEEENIRKGEFTSARYNWLPKAPREHDRPSLTLDEC